MEGTRVVEEHIKRSCWYSERGRVCLWSDIVWHDR